MRETLLAAVLAAPQEDAPRLAFADWLLKSENATDRAHGELIQVQCALARLDESGPARARLVRRAAAVLQEHGVAFVRNVLGPDTWSPEEYVSLQHFRRGFLAVGLVDDDTDVPFERLAHLDEWLARAPIEELRVYVTTVVEANEKWAPLERAALERFPSLSLGVWEDAYNDNPGLDEAAERAVSLVERLPLKQLELGDAYGTGFRLDASLLRKLVNAPVAAGLRELRLAGSALKGAWGIWRDAWTTAFVEPSELGQLETLYVEHSEITPRELVDLAATPHLPNLRRLHLDSTLLGADDCARLLAARPGLIGLTIHVHVDRAFLKIARLEHIEELKLQSMYGYVGAGLWGPLIDALPRLRRLDACFHKPQLADVRAIGGGPRLRELVLRSCGLDDKAAEVLTEAPQLEELEVLDLRDNYRIQEPARARLRSRFGAAVRF